MTPEQFEEDVLKTLDKWEGKGKILAKRLAKDTRDMDDQDAFKVFEIFVTTLSDEALRIRKLAESLDRLQQVRPN